LPLDLLVYETGSLRVSKFVHIDENNEYMQMIRSTWGARLRQVFGEIPDPAWRDAPPGSTSPYLERNESSPVRAPLPAEAGQDGAPPGEPPGPPAQTLAQHRPLPQTGER
jgi:putative proteasome-type protease